MKSAFSVIGAFFGGVVFAVGLGIGGMTEPQNIISFLDIFGEWDPSLAFVMLGAVGSYAILFRLVIKYQAAPLGGSEFFIPSNKVIDKKLIFGSSLFGIGWGITGLCPGPGLASLSSGQAYGFVFVVMVVVGIFLAGYIEKRGWLS